MDRTRTFVAFAMIALSPMVVAAPAVTMDAVPLGPVQGETGHYQPMPIVTKDGSRTILIGSQGSRVQAFVDGVAGSVVNEIPIQPAVPSAVDGSMHGWPTFSADQKRFAYVVGLDNGKKAVVIDGTQSPVYDGVSWLGFAPSGHHFAYIAKRGDQMFCVDDGKAGMTYQNVFADHASFSPDGAHFAYSTVVSDKNAVAPIQQVHTRPQHQCYVLDGVEQKKFENLGPPIFSKDGKHFAYIAGIDGFTPTRVVVDGKEGKAYTLVEELKISDDGSRVAYMARRGVRSDSNPVVVDNGTEGSEYGLIQNLIVSHDGKRVVYSAAQANTSQQYFLVENGKPGKQYQYIEFVLVSPDSKTVIYNARAQQGQFLVANDQEFGPFTQIHERPVFSEDGHWACFVALPAGGNAIVIDGKTTPVIPAIAPSGLAFQQGTNKLLITSRNNYNGAPVVIEAASMPKDQTQLPSAVIYSPNQQHTIKVFTSGAGSSQGKDTATVDDKPIADDNWQSISKPCVSDDGRHFAFIAAHTQGGGAPGYHVVFDGKEGPAYPVIDNVDLTPDGAHVAYVAEDHINKVGNWFVVLDGMAGPAFQDVLPITAWTAGETRLRFDPDGSLHFLGVMDKQVYRCSYPASAFTGMPTMAAVESGKPGPREMCKIQGPGHTHMQFVIAPDDMIYGIAIGEGKFKKGILYKVKTDGSGYTVLKDFYGGDDDGQDPLSILLTPDNSAIMGVFDGGKIFRFDLKSQDYKVTQISGNPFPAEMCGFAKDGSIIGLAGSRGPGDKPATFSMSPDGSNYKTHPNNDNVEPRRALTQIVQAKDGSFIALGRLKGKGVLFKFANLTDEPTVMHQFKNMPDDGGNPETNLVMSSAGDFYGSTTNGGNSQKGVFFKFSPATSKYEILYNPETPDFPHLFAPADDGTLYGLDKEGVFKVSPGATKAENILKFDGGEYTSYNGGPEICFHDNALIGRANKTLYRINLPSAGGTTPSAAPAAPGVTITKSQPPALATESVTFTEPTGPATFGMADVSSQQHPQPQPQQSQQQANQQQQPNPQQQQQQHADQTPKPNDPANKAINKADKNVKKLKKLFGQ
jgi:uncharacterized repeat protein (TIGR03803 family)